MTVYIYMCVYLYVCMAVCLNSVLFSLALFGECFVAFLMALACGSDSWELELEWWCEAVVLVC